MKTTINKQIIDNYIKEHKLTKTKFCKLCKISPIVLNKMINGGNYRIVALVRLVKVLKVEIFELFQ